MRTDPNPFIPAILLTNSKLPADKMVPLILDSIENEIALLANDATQLFYSTQSRLQYLFTSGVISKELFQKISLIRADHVVADDKQLLNSTIAVLLELIATSTNQPIPDYLNSYQFSLPGAPDGKITPEKAPEKSGRISILKFDTLTNTIDFVFEKGEVNIQQIALNELPEKKRKLFHQALKYLKLPFDVYAHQLSKQSGSWLAEEFILLPDFLIDVTAITSCYSHSGSNPLKHLINLFYFRPTAYSALVGTAVNQFLDELILTPELSFEEISQNLFHHNPIAFSLLQDSEVLKFQDTIRIHFHNIKKVVTEHFNHLVDRLEDCLMEPSFYSIEYGIQGRLDIFYENKNTLQKLIIELKSGKPFLPNRFGINADHHAQIMLYYLMIQSVYGSYQKVQSQVLYSSQNENALKPAPVLVEIKQELIHLRNSLILLHLHLAYRSASDPFILDLISEKNYSQAESYTKRDATIVLNIYSGLTRIEKDYFKELCGFIAREQFIAKMGRANMQYTEGLASLWLLTEHEKINNFMILHGLKIRDMILEKGEYPILILRPVSDNEHLSNFRIGDTLVMYSGATALKEQIYKCTFIEQFKNEYHVRLRTRQFPDMDAAKQKTWNLEHDSLDRSFINQFQGLLEFSQAGTENRQRLMGLLAPRLNPDQTFKTLSDTPERIQATLKKIIQSRDYFILWGPPGSGKTSMVIKHLTRLLFDNTNEHVLLLAYTNRAVDEICEAIESIQTEEPIEYIRIGSRFAVSPKFRANLLEEKIGTFKNRKQLQQLLKRTRIFTATIASIQGKKELFYLKKFDTVIIDEASQILESQLCGLLYRFDRFILIGDHMQLPAVTAQTEAESGIHSDHLITAGFQSLSMSFFERLLQQCKNNEWHHAYEMLTFQGRMHEDLMKFPNQVFYNNQLQILPDGDYNRQSKAYATLFSKTADEIQSALGTHRTLYIPCENQELLQSSKTNLAEARLVCTLIKQLVALYHLNSKKWDEFSLGVITPFRAQIAQIKNQIHQNGLDQIPITVDTAERYQGSTRDIIIISTVISNENQLSQISSINALGVDRKLNVALTRAKEQIILIGNQNALKASPLYNQLIKEYWYWNPGIPMP
jgi:DNA replication ATP-dependent helicase Dna2